MADIEVIYDPAKEFAAIINLDTRSGWGPAFIGPNAGNVLQLWVDAMPFDVTILSEDAALTVFTDWLQEMAGAPTQEAPTPPDSPVEPMGADPVGEWASAEVEAHNARTEPPEPGPADTDMEADESPPDTFVNCPLCNGTKTVVDDETGEVTPCNMCAGMGVIRMAVPS